MCVRLYKHCKHVSVRTIRRGSIARSRPERSEIITSRKRHFRWKEFLHHIFVGGRDIIIVVVVDVGGGKGVVFGRGGGGGRRSDEDEEVGRRQGRGDLHGGATVLLC